MARGIESSTRRRNVESGKKQAAAAGAASRATAPPPPGAGPRVLPPAAAAPPRAAAGGGKEQQRAGGRRGSTPAAGSSVVPLRERPMDFLYAVLYLALTAVSAAALLGPDCSVLVPPAAAAACPPAPADGAAPGAPGAPVLAGLWRQWQEQSPASPRRADAAAVFLLRADLCANLLLAPLLACTMLAGAALSSRQVAAVVHLTVTFIANCAFAATSQSLPQAHAGRVAAAFFLALPVALLRRWWCEWPFSARAVGPLTRRGRAWRLYNFTVSLAVLCGAAYTAVAVYDWAIASHKDLGHLPPVQPLIDEAVASAQGAGALCQAHAQEALDKGLPLAREFAERAATSAAAGLEHLGEAVMAAVQSFSGAAGANATAASGGK